MAEVLVTGAGGLLGSELVSQLAGRHDVVGLGRRPCAKPRGTRWIVSDLAEPSARQDLPAHIDVVVHLAQSRRFRNFPSGATDVFAVNVASTALLLDWAVTAGARQFVLASTGGVYEASSDPHHEDEVASLSRTASFYAASKLAAETLARSYVPLLAVCVLRPFFIYGRGQDPEMLLPRLARSVREREPIVVDGDDGMRFNPVHVGDAARAVTAALDVETSCVVNVAGPEVLTLRRAVELLAARLGTEAVVRSRSDVPVTDMIADTSRMEALLVPPATTLADAVDEIGT